MLSWKCGLPAAKAKQQYSSATYQLEVSGGDIKAVQGNTGHAQGGILVDTYAHIQNRARIDLAARIEQDFYSAGENDTPVHNPIGSTEKMSFGDILVLLQQADSAQKKQRMHEKTEKCAENVQERRFTDKKKNLTFSREVLVRPQELESWTL